MTNEMSSSPERVKSAERVLDIIEALSAENEGMSFSMLQRSLDIPKSSLHGLLDVLTSRGYLEYQPDTRCYSRGFSVDNQEYTHGLCCVAVPIYKLWALAVLG